MIVLPKIMIVTVAAVILCQGFVRAEDPVTLSNTARAPRITGNEPIARRFSASRAAHYLDTASLSWQKVKKCATCHTNMPYLFARPALNFALKDSGEVRTFFEEYRTVRWKNNKVSKKASFWPVVLTK